MIVSSIWHDHTELHFKKTFLFFSFGAHLLVFLAHPASSVTFCIITLYHHIIHRHRDWDDDDDDDNDKTWRHICWTNFGITRLWVSWLTSVSCPNKVITTCDDCWCIPFGCQGGGLFQLLIPGLATSGTLLQQYFNNWNIARRNLVLR